MKLVQGVRRRWRRLHVARAAADCRPATGAAAAAAAATARQPSQIRLTVHYSLAVGARTWVPAGFRARSHEPTDATAFGFLREVAMRKFCENLARLHRRKSGACWVRPQTWSLPVHCQHELFMIILHLPHKFLTPRRKQDICISRMISQHARAGCTAACPISSSLPALVKRCLR